MSKIYHKFGAIRCERDNIKFPSKLERSCYDYLNVLKRRGEILFFIRQIPFDLPAGFKHFVDFCVFTSDNVIFVEAKGRDLETGKMKRKQVEEIYGITVHTVKNAYAIDDVLKLNKSL